MSDQDLAKQLMATFLEELRDHTSNIGRELLAMEKNLSDEERDAAWAIVFRAAHTIKGASAVVAVEPIHAACHSMEDIFGVYRDRCQTMPKDLTSMMLKAVDAIEDVAKRLQEDVGIEDAPLVKLVPELQRLASEQTSVPEQVADDCPDETVASADANLDSLGEELTTKATPQPLSKMETALRAAFLDELDEHVSTISQNSLALESSSEGEERSQILHLLFRAAHSLKGAAGVVHATAVLSACHYLEDLLTGIRDGETLVSPKVVSQILEASDLIGDTGRRMRQNESLEDAPIQKLIRKLAGSAKKVVGSPKSKTEPMASARDVAGKDESQPDTSTERTVKPEAGAEHPSKPEASGDGSQEPRLEAEQPKPAPATSRTMTPAVDKVASLRVAAHKLDALLAHSGELLVARGRFAFRAHDVAQLRELASELRKYWRDSRATIRHLVNDLSDSGSDPKLIQRATSVFEKTAAKISFLSEKLDSLSVELESDNRLLGQTCGLLDDEVYHVRMLPFSDACGQLSRAVRDIAAGSNKSVTLEIIGAEVEVDRSVLEGLKDPLLHLVRNAVDHGIESIDVRQATGKPAQAILKVSAALRGGQVEVIVEDDGTGLDLQRIIAVARKREIDIPDDPREQARLIFASGFSTAKLITDISGRGVGLDVVKSQVESLHGTVDVRFEKGKGTKFVLMVPLTLTTIRSILVVAGGQTYAIPTSTVERLTRFDYADVRTSAGRDSLLVRDSPIALVSLAKTLGLKATHHVSTATGKGLAVVVKASDQRVALAVDEIYAEQEVLVKNFGGRIKRLLHFSGCTLLPSGTVALVMSTANVVRSALGLTSLQGNVSTSTERTKRTQHLLLVDDSVTTRMLLKNILENAGYNVVVAGDGQQAWDLSLQQRFDIVVSDVDMPRMDGIELTAKLREDPTMSEIPIVLVTARGTDQDKERGVRAGANAYIVKGSFDQQNLLDTVAQLI